MKKSLLVLSVVMLFAGQIFANPVDVNTARELGAKYLKNNVLSAKNITDVEHVYTLTSDNGTPYLYVFNHANGYVVVAADDRAYPILGFDESTPFDENNIPDGMRYYLGHYGTQIQYAIDNEMVADQEVADQWELLRKEGITSRITMNRAVTPILTTTWNQDYPYNYYAPASSNWMAPGGHCYAGCVATAMSQAMKHWNWPTTGVGEHSYSTSTTGGTLSANFGATTYNWSIMPNSLGSSVNTAAQAVALLMYHCGVAVDMNYNYNGSGAYTENVPDALKNYFRYADCTYVDSRDAYTKTAWEDKLIALLDRGIPTVYAGSDSDGGHAFNCDGYNANRYFHFNWGWSGSYQSTYYQIDALNTPNGSFNQNQRVVFEMLPDYVYEAMVPAIETMEAMALDAIGKTVHITFTVPTTSESGAALTSISKIVVKRNGTAVHTFNNPQPGEVLSYDDNVNEYGAYEYSIAGENNGHYGKAFTQIAIVGPSCTWKFVCQTTNFQGWNSGVLRLVAANGTIIKEITMTSSTPVTEKVRIPEGSFTLKWIAPLTTVSSLTINLKDSAGQNAYTFSGSSTQLNGTVYTGNNDCPSCTAPTGFAGDAYQGGARLTWNCDYNPSQFKIYRSTNGDNYTEIGTAGGSAREYLDGAPVGTYYYKVTAYSSSCESDYAMTSGDTDYVIVEVNGVAENSINAIIYPNPTTGVVRVEAPALNSVALYNLVGQKIYEENINGDECVINMKEFGSGIYMMQIRTSNGMTTQKVSVIE